MTVSCKGSAVVLASASSGGTIAAVRQLASMGISVNVMSSERLAAAAWSSRAERIYRAPRECDTQRFMECLLAIGEARSGSVLLATSDVTAHLYATHASALEQYFRLYQAPLEAITRLLDKASLAELAERAGLTVLPTFVPSGLDEVIMVAPTLSYPLLIKPRSHVHRLRNDKGMVVKTPCELIAKYRQILEREGMAADRSRPCEASLPILQHFVNVGSEGVHSITGFIDRKGELFVTRHSTKVFLRSQPVGVGLCYESLEPDPELSASVHRLCQDVGYFGVFEVEFVRFDGTWAIIDFNPRFFNQVGLDIRRGMPLPLLAWLDATGDTVSLKAEVARAQACESTVGKVIFYDQFTFNIMLAVRLATGRISWQEFSSWRAWTTRHRGAAVDVAVDARDRMPGVVHAVSELCLGLMALPRFVTVAHDLPAQTSYTLIKAPQ